MSEDIIGSVLYYDKDSTMERRYRQVLKLVTSSQTGQFWTCDALKLSGQISDAQIESIRTQHKGKLPPYYFIDSISRIYDNRSYPPKQYITCHFSFKGLRVGDVEGVVNQEENLGMGTHGYIGFHNLVKLGSRRVTTKDGQNIEVPTYNGIPPQGIEMRVYEIPWSREVFDVMMKHTQDGQVGLHIQDIAKGKSYAPRSVEEFLSEDIEELIKSYEQPANQQQPLFKDSKDLQDYSDFLRWKKAREEQDREDKNHFQQVK